MKAKHVVDVLTHRTKENYSILLELAYAIEFNFENKKIYVREKFSLLCKLLNIKDESGSSILLNSTYFCQKLLEIFADEFTVLFWILESRYTQRLGELDQKVIFTKTLMEQDGFFEVFFGTRGKPQFSLLSKMMEEISTLKPSLQIILSSDAFKKWVVNQPNLESLASALLDDIKVNRHLSLLSSLFLRDKDRFVIGLLFLHDTVKNAFIKLLGVPPEATIFIAALLKCEEAYFLLRSLNQNNRSTLLKLNSLQRVFESPQIQQLIHLRRIKAEWFLMMAFYSADRHKEMAFFLNQPSISPWVTDNTSRYLHHLIQINEDMDDNKKDQLKVLLAEAYARYSQRQIHLLTIRQGGDSPSPVTVYLDSSPSTNDSSSKRLRLEEPKPDLKEVDDRFSSAINWIQAQSSLGNYHEPYFQFYTICNPKLKLAKQIRSLLKAF